MSHFEVLQLQFILSVNIQVLIHWKASFIHQMGKRLEGVGLVPSTAFSVSSACVTFQLAGSHVWRTGLTVAGQIFLLLFFVGVA